MSDTPTFPVPANRRQLPTLDQLAAIPEEEIWLAKQKSRQTRRAYRLDVRHFMRALGITSTDALAPGRSSRRHRVGADAARAGRRSSFDHAPPPRGAFQPVQASCPARGGEPQSRGGRGAAGDQSRRRQHRRVLESRRRAKCSTRRRPTRSPVCATAPFCPSACRSDSAARRSPR